MNYKDALEIGISQIAERIKNLGDDALKISRKQDEDLDAHEKWQALKSAQGGMTECLDLLQQLLTMAKSYDSATSLLSNQQSVDE